MTHPEDTRSTEALAAELRRIVDQAEELLGAAGANGEQLGALKDRVNDTIGQAKARLSDLEREARASGRRAAAATETWVRTNPLTALAIGAGIGLIIGATLLIRPGAAAAPDDTDAG